MKFSNLAFIFSLAVSAIAQANNQEGSKPKAEIIYHCKQPNNIAFTIDDGPTDKTTELLAALKDAGIVATFYVNGANVLKDLNGEPLPSVKPFIKDIYDAGHEIGSHTYNHACLTEQCKLNNPLMKVMDTKEAFTEQIIKNENLIYDAIGIYPATYRAPFGDGQNPGAVNDTLLEWLYELGYPYAIHWDIETRDMENSYSGGDDFAFEQAKLQYESETAQKDTVITLQHAIPVTVEKIIPYIKNVWMPAHPNMKFVKVSECLGLSDDKIYKKTQGSVKGNASSDAFMVKTSLFFIVSTLFAVLYML
ncbi:glycoside hydrolase/deacetylase [Piromyces finnis]|uniref:Glycoside hydrolase/deacetylase n=1 Tax=Piromyces finnis TaxID=1754191 RepID=A0A1Y1VMH6_9FUNG|nr:glycoside hydrolase/deacetylase [Piromyces finnis]|eukprot:ORX60123.1 glycoside hydrolase/deacetylase [Piromyces finnis]